MKKSLFSPARPWRAKARLSPSGVLDTREAYLVKRRSFPDSDVSRFTFHERRGGLFRSLLYPRDSAQGQGRLAGCQRHLLEAPWPRVTIQLSEQGRIHLVLRFPAPDRGRSRNEQAILRRFLAGPR